jgi:hypothetical protein
VIGMLSSACAEPDPAPLTRDEAGFLWCQASCEAKDRCGDSISDDCVEQCERDAAGFFERIRPEVLEVDARCFERASCEQGFDMLFTSCQVEREPFVPTEAAVQFCEAMAEPFFECLYFGTPDACTWTLAPYGEAALESGARCRNESCDQLATCLNENLWWYGEPEVTP